MVVDGDVWWLVEIGLRFGHPAPYGTPIALAALDVKETAWVGSTTTPQAMQEPLSVLAFAKKLAGCFRCLATSVRPTTLKNIRNVR